MLIETGFELPFPIEQSWEFLQDFTRVAACVPGAALTEIVNERQAKGQLTIRLWVLKLRCGGVVTVIEHDEESHRVVVRAEAANEGVAGKVRDTMTSTLASGDGTVVSVTHDIEAFGGLANYGRAVTGIVLSVLTKQFSRCVAAKIQEGANQEVEGPEPSLGY